MWLFGGYCATSTSLGYTIEAKWAAAKGKKRFYSNLDWEVARWHNWTLHIGQLPHFFVRISFWKLNLNVNLLAFCGKRVCAPGKGAPGECARANDNSGNNIAILAQQFCLLFHILSNFILSHKNNHFVPKAACPFVIKMWYLPYVAGAVASVQ
jgi:hypothetical protein